MTNLEIAQLLGSLGEFVGAIAVLATLIFLSIQVRHGANLMEENIKTRQLESVNQYIFFMGDFRASIYRDAEMAELWRLKDTDLDETQRMRVLWAMADFVMRSRSAFLSCRLSGMPDQMENAAFVLADEIAPSLRFREIWAAMKHYHTSVAPEFVYLVDSRLSDGGT